MQLQQAKQELLMRKIGRRKDEIQKYMISGVTPITDIVYRETDKFERYEDAIQEGSYAPIGIRERWGGGLNGWFKIRFAVPDSFKGKEVAAFLNLGGEGCAFIDGRPYQGIDAHHEEILLLKSAKGGENFEIVIDAISKPWSEPGMEKLVEVSRAEIATRNPEVQEYWYNLHILQLLAEALPRDSARRAKLIYTLDKSVDAFDYTHTDEASLKTSALAANAVLKPLLDRKASESATSVAVHGHSHIDVAWLWPYRETKRKCARTFSTVMRMMEQYPDYLFSQSQAQLYEYTKENYPTIYEEIKKRVKEGRWDVTGSMWVEADCNLCSGESLVRQVLVGKNYFMDEFGIETDVLWLPDVFGYSAALPQILKKSRVNYFSTIKIGWNQFNRFPYNTFHWRGIDNTAVLAHFPPTADYNAYPDPRILTRQVSEFIEKDRSDESLLSYGWGDGGGGPDRRHLELLARSKDLEGLPRCRQKKITEFFHGIDGAAEYPEWVGELYLELHRGTYTTQAKNKWYNRRCEFLYRDAELLSSLAAPMGLTYPYDDLHREWKRLLCNQFHDVIPGSSIRAVYEDTDEMYPEIMAVGEEAADAAFSRIVQDIDTSGDGDALVVFNTLPWERAEIVSVKLPGEGEYAVSASDRGEVPSQVREGKIAFVASVPSMGYSTYRLIKKSPGKFNSDLIASKSRLENRFYRIEMDSDGVISSLVHKDSGREVLMDGRRGNLLQLFEDKPNDWPAWDIDFYYGEKFEDLTGLESVTVVDEGPVYSTLETVRKFNKSEIKQRIVIYAAIPRIDFQTWVDWHEDEKVLKASFPVNVNASKARYEIQFGNTERPTHSNTSWDFARFEVCAHKWADISEQGFGVSLMNDCKYGYHTTGSEMRLTLLRSPKEPDPVADMGQHEFTYSLMPHQGDYIEAGTVRQGYSLNVPLRAMLVKSSKGALPPEKSFISVDVENVVLEAVKRAEKEDATILRFYECHNASAAVTVKLDIPFKQVFECDLMESNLVEVDSKNGEFSFAIKPFEIKTFKLV